MPPIFDRFKILELNFNEPKIKVLNLKLIFNADEFWRTGLDVYFLYKLHFVRFPRSLRPSFPTSLLDFDFPINYLNDFYKTEYFAKLIERLEHFFDAFFEICGVELQTLNEFHDFLDSSIEICKFPRELDSADYNVLPVKEWFPATSRFIRSSLTRIRQRSPSPHLDLNAVELKVNGYEDEKRLSVQRIRLADFEPIRTDLIDFQIESSSNSLDLRSFYKETREFDERKGHLEQSLKSISYLMNTISGCKSLINEINSILVEDSEFFGNDLIEQNILSTNKIEIDLKKIEDNLKYPLNIQLDDVYSLTRGLNERIFALKYLDTALCDQKLACQQLSQIQSESISAMDRAQGSLINLTSSSLAFDRKISAKNAEIEKRIGKVEELSTDFFSLDKHITNQLEKWEQISDTFLMEKFKFM